MFSIPLSAFRQVMRQAKSKPHSCKALVQHAAQAGLKSALPALFFLSLLAQLNQINALLQGGGCRLRQCQILNIIGHNLLQRQKVSFL